MKDFDIASGVTPLIHSPTPKKKRYDKPIINEKRFNKKGDIIHYGDDCGYLYEDSNSVGIPANEFRSCALMKKEVVKKIKYETNLSPVGFREEAFFSLRAQWEGGFKIGVDTNAIAWHFQSPNGGCRNADYVNMVQSDDKYFKKWAKKMYKKYGDLNG